ncbi:MAG: hypothetical protein IT530_21160 [Burkholderiales bacterium]|nr:hypothetical protein [Burkholderiales bacterium]
MNAQHTKAADAGQDAAGWIVFQKGTLGQEHSGERPEQEEVINIIAMLRLAYDRLDNCADLADRLVALTDAVNIMREDHKRHEDSIGRLIEFMHQVGRELAGKIVNDNFEVEKAIWALERQQNDSPGAPLYVVAQMLNTIANDAFSRERQDDLVEWGSALGRVANRSEVCRNALEVWRQWLERHGCACGVLNDGAGGLRLKQLGAGPSTRANVKEAVQTILEDAIDSRRRRTKRPRNSR